MDDGVSAGNMAQDGVSLSTAATIPDTSFAIERASAGQHLEQHDSECPDVHPFVDGLSHRLLRRHVGRRTENQPHFGRARIMRRRVRTALGTPRVECFGEPEVQDFHRAVVSHFDVRRLQIAMDDPVLMRLLERLGDLARNRQRVLEWHGPARDQRLELRAIDQFHDQGLDAVGLLKTVDVGDMTDDSGQRAPALRAGIVSAFEDPRRRDRAGP